MTIDETLAQLLQLREESQAAQIIAAKARQAFDEAAFDAARAIRASLGHDDAVGWVLPGWFIALRSTHHPGIKDSPWQFIRIADDA